MRVHQSSITEHGFRSTPRALKELRVLFGVRLDGVIQREGRCVHGADRALLGQLPIREERAHGLDRTERWKRERTMLLAVSR